jgi:hypothetical protein
MSGTRIGDAGNPIDRYTPNERANRVKWHPKEWSDESTWLAKSGLV